MRRFATLCTSTAAASVVATTVGWPAMAFASTVVGITLGCGCWVLNDAGRAARLARLIREVRRPE